MKTSYRAAISVAMLAGFPVLVLATCAALVLLDVFALGNVERGQRFAIWSLCVTIPLVFALLAGLFSVERPYLGRVPELPVSPEEQPRLWALVRELSEAVGTRPPDEIFLVPHAEVAVSEETRLLGLRVLGRRMSIGAPLLAALDEGRLHAVLVREIGRYANNDTRFSGPAERGRRSMERTLARLSSGNLYQRSIAQVFGLYGTVYLKVSTAVSRRQEIAAGETAERLLGGTITASAYREADAIHRAWDLFVRDYAEFGWRTRYLPEHLSDGFSAFLADETRQHELSMPRHTNGTRPAREILAGARATLDTAMETLLTGKSLAKGRLTWPELIERGTRVAAVDVAQALLSRASMAVRTDAVLGTLFDALDTGRLNTLDDDGDYDERGTVRAQLSTVAELALVDAGAARWALSWSGPAELVIDAPSTMELEAAIDSAAADVPNTAPLRALLVASGVPGDYRPSTKAPLVVPREFDGLGGDTARDQVSQ
jgi:hypothetical protein